MPDIENTNTNIDADNVCSLRFTRNEVEDILKSPSGREWLSEHSTNLKNSSNSELIDVLYRLGEECTGSPLRSKSAIVRWLNETMYNDRMQKLWHESAAMKKSIIRNSTAWKRSTAQEAVDPGGTLDKILFQKLLVTLEIPYQNAKSCITEAYPCEAVPFNPCIVEEYACLCCIMKGWTIDEAEMLIKDIGDLVPDVTKIVSEWASKNSLRATLNTKTLINLTNKFLDGLDRQLMYDIKTDYNSVSTPAKEEIIKYLNSEAKTISLFNELLSTRYSSKAFLDIKYAGAYIPENVETPEEEDMYEHPTITEDVAREEEEVISTFKDVTNAYHHAKNKIRHFREVRRTMRDILDERFLKLGIDIFKHKLVKTIKTTNSKQSARLILKKAGKDELTNVAKELYETNMYTSKMRTMSLDTLTDNLVRCIYANSKNLSRKLFIECLFWSARNTISVEYINEMLGITVFQHKLDVFDVQDACFFEASHRAMRERKHAMRDRKLAWEIYVENYKTFIAPSLQPTITPTIVT